MFVDKNELPLILKSEHISEILDLKEAATLALIHEAEVKQDTMFPVLRRGKRIIRIPRDPFFTWLEKPKKTK